MFIHQILIYPLLVSIILDRCFCRSYSVDFVFKTLWNYLNIRSNILESWAYYSSLQCAFPANMDAGLGERCGLPASGCITRHCRSQFIWLPDNLGSSSKWNLKSAMPRPASMDLANLGSCSNIVFYFWKIALCKWTHAVQIWII